MMLWFGDLKVMEFIELRKKRRSYNAMNLSIFISLLVYHFTKKLLLCSITMIACVIYYRSHTVMDQWNIHFA